jgi:putative hemolysin
MAVLLTAATPAGTSGYTLLIADDEADIRAAQRLRHDVFAEELGAALNSAQPSLDADDFDAYCDHLIVRDALDVAAPGTGGS